MKYTVIKNFIDKESGKAQKKGSTFECTEERFKEIRKKGNFLAAEKETKAVKK